MKDERGIDPDILDQLPGDIKRIAEVVGVEAAIKIAQAFPKTYLYVHNIDDLMRQIRDQKIRAEYDSGDKVPDIAIRYRLSERWVWCILGIESDTGASPSLLDLLK